MCFTLCDYTSNMKFFMEVFILKGSALLCMEDAPTSTKHGCEDMSWEYFEEWFWERYFSEEFIEHQLNEVNTLRQGSRTVYEYEAKFMELLRYAPHMNTKKLKVKLFCVFP
jgi:hypothetical protein